MEAVAIVFSDHTTWLSTRNAPLHFLPHIAAIFIALNILPPTTLPCFAQSSLFLPSSPVPSLWTQSAPTVRAYVAPSDPTSDFIDRAERAVKVFWRDLINDPYATGPGAKAFKTAAASVVYIITDTRTGTGLVTNEQGFIVVDAHVIKDAQTVAAVFRPRNIADIGKNLIITANVMKIDLENDLAVLKLPHPPRNIRPATFGDMAKVNVGEQVFSIGLPTPRGWVYSEAIVTALNSPPVWSEEYSNRIRHTEVRSATMTVRSDTRLGSAGGPMLNTNGAIIGLKAMYDPETLHTYVIPADAITSFLDTLPATTEISNLEDSASWATRTLTAWRKNGILKQFDTNDDGIIDRIGIDSDQNRYVDAWIVDEDQNGAPDYIARDVDKNGRHEKRAYDRDGDGTYETHYFDHNNDDQADVIGTDVDGDGIVDTFALIRK